MAKLVANGSNLVSIRKENGEKIVFAKKRRGSQRKGGEVGEWRIFKGENSIEK